MFGNKNLMKCVVPAQLRHSYDGPNGAVHEAGMAGPGLRLLAGTRVRWAVTKAGPYQTYVKPFFHAYCKLFYVFRDTSLFYLCRITSG